MSPLPACRPRGPGGKRVQLGVRVIPTALAAQIRTVHGPEPGFDAW
jgi:hypothetical protein